VKKGISDAVSPAATAVTDTALPEAATSTKGVEKSLETKPETPSTNLVGGKRRRKTRRARKSKKTMRSKRR
jgi:hypothetical protein